MAKSQEKVYKQNILMGITPGEKYFLQFHSSQGREHESFISHISICKRALSTPLIKQAITQLFRVHMQCAFILFSWVHILSCLFHPLKNSSFLPPTANAMQTKVYQIPGPWPCT